MVDGGKFSFTQGLDGPDRIDVKKKKDSHKKRSDESIGNRHTSLYLIAATIMCQ